MDQAEIARLETYLRKAFGARDLKLRARGSDEADLLRGTEKLGAVSKDEDEGELSYFVNVSLARAPGAKKDAPIDDAERARLQTMMRDQIGSPALQVRARPRKTDSAEVYVADEFIGTVSADEDEGPVLTMSILDIDLED